jgi:8-oxo-dGTP pyrophosphatase MutT (NUDIX family)
MYRLRCEMLCFDLGKVGIAQYENGEIGFPGGGVSRSEPLEVSAAREFQEECGWSVSRPTLIDVPPCIHKWTGPMSAKKKARARRYIGSETYYARGTCLEREGLGESDEERGFTFRFAPIEEVLGVLLKHARKGDEKATARVRALLKVIPTGRAGYIEGRAT